MPKVIKNRAIHLRECLLGFCFNVLISRHTNFGCIDSFLSLPNSRNEEMMGDGAFGATAAGLF